MSPSRRFALALLLVLAPTLALAQGGSLTVTTLDDHDDGLCDADCTLREAIHAANGDGGLTTITFAPGMAGGTILLASPLPQLVEAATTIDGDLGGDCMPDIGIDGSAITAGVLLDVSLAGGVVRGLAFYRMPGCEATNFSSLVHVGGSTAIGNLLECNSFGLGPGGGEHPGHCLGIRVDGGAQDNHFERNRFTGAEAWAIYLEDAGLPAYPEFDGLTPDLVTEIATLDLTDDCQFFKVRDGATFYDAGGHPFNENFGLRLTGQIQIAEEGDYTFTWPWLDDLGRLFVKDATLVDWGGGGTPPPAVKHLEAGSHPIRLDFFEGGGAAGVALTVSGPQPVAYSTDGNLGGCAAGHAGLCGELFQLRVPSERNTITRNQFWNNGRGIVTNCCCGPAVNDPGDLDLGPNTLLNTPVIDSVTGGGPPGSYVASGTAPPNSVVELFAAWMDPTYTHGQGQEFLGWTTADAGGSFSVPIGISLWTNFMVATATDPDGNTSEFSAPFLLTDNRDAVTVADWGTEVPGAEIEIPVYVRDQKLTLLGRDRAAGERIQGFAFKVVWEPASAVTLARFEPAGITAALTPIVAPIQTQNGNTAGWVVAYNEATNEIPFGLDTPPPGNQVAKLVLTLAPNAPTGRVTLTLDPVTALHNQAGTIEETLPSGTLILTAGSIDVLSHAAQGVLAFPYFSGIMVTWSDPHSNEIGFRLERSFDGTNWETAALLGPDDTGFQDLDRPPATLHYYRVVTLVDGGDGQVSNRAAATTHAAVATPICGAQQSALFRHARYASSAWSGSEWAVAYHEAGTAPLGEIFFQRLAAGDGQPLGPPVRVTASDSGSSLPTLRWNGTHYGLIWNESMRGEPGTPGLGASRQMFALLAPDGGKVRGDVPLPTPFGGWINNNAKWAFDWDGSHWGLFGTDWTATPPFSRVIYLKLDEDGDTVLGPVPITATLDRWENDVAAAFSPTESLYGVAWKRYENTPGGPVEVWFQRVEEADGTPVGGAVLLGSWLGSPDGLDIAWDAATGAWAVVWSQWPSDGSEAPLMLRKVAADGSPIGPGPERLSDDPDPEDPRWDELPVVTVTSAGEVRAFAWSGDNATGAYEVGLLRADASGARLGSRILVTPFDGLWQAYPQVASDGARQLVAFNDATAGSLEVGAVLVDESALPGALVPLTSGHIPGNTYGTFSGGPAKVAPLGAGFVAVWMERTSGTPTLAARAYDGTGSITAEALPLTATPLGHSAFDLVAAGGTFALVFRDAGGGIRFSRFDEFLNRLTPEEGVVVTGANGPTAIGFDGERYGLVFRRSGGWSYASVWPDGSLAEQRLPLALTPPGNSQPHLFWLGSSWALVWQSWEGSTIFLGRFSASGDVLLPATPLTPPAAYSSRNQYAAAFGGDRIAVAWVENLGPNPPGQDIHYTIVGLDGGILSPAAVAASSVFSESGPRLLWRGGTFHLLYAGEISGIHEIEIDPAGALIGTPRAWANRGTPAAVATNGATTALAWTQPEVFLMTDFCLADSTRPPCPNVAISSVDHRIRLNWSGGGDPESGHWRTMVFRGEAATPGSERAVAELFLDTTSLDDGGFTLGAIHTYQVLAMNGAFRLSEGCPLLSFSTVRGDANGDGVVDGTDIFYLVNHLLAGGPPPLGDADANGSGGVTTGDIFYLINWLYAGGPAPEWSGETLRLDSLPGRLAAAPHAALSTREAEEAVPASDRPRSTVALGKAMARAGATIAIPVTLVDAAGTPLGRDRDAEAPIQALALSVNVLPAGAVTAIEVRRAGVLARPEPLFESRPVHAAGAALVVSFDEAFAPLPISSAGVSASRTPPATAIAEVVVTLARELAPGTAVELRLDPGTTLLSNQAGTVSETAANGWLALRDGRIEVTR